MENKKDYIFKKAVDWIFRKKTLVNIFAFALLRELMSIGIGDLLTELKVDQSLQDWYFHYPIIFLNFVFSGGNWSVVWIFIALIIFLKISDLIEIHLNNKKEKELKESDSKKSTLIKAKKIKKIVTIEKVEGGVHL